MDNNTAVPQRKLTKRQRTWRRVLTDYQLYLMFIPGLVVLAIFAYFPMYGITLAFKDYQLSKGFFGSPWYGLNNFRSVFETREFLFLIKNTLWLGLLKLIFAFPSSIILALLFNEISIKIFKKTVQTISYLPYFISWIIVHSVVYMLLATDYGFINNLFGVKIQWYSESSYWPAIITLTGIWKNAGWGTIIFLAGLTGISPELYEAARCDGAGRWKQCWHVSLPGIMPVIMMSFILSVSGIVKDDFEQIYALTGNNQNLKSMKVIGVWIYTSYKYGPDNYGAVTAMGLMQSLVSLVLVIGANFVSRKTGNKGLW